MKGKPRNEIVAKLHEANIHDDTINKLLPVETEERAEVKGEEKKEPEKKE